jgi:hypothetical protein
MNENFAKTTTPLAYLEQSLDFDPETQKLYEIGRAALDTSHQPRIHGSFS